MHLPALGFDLQVSTALSLEVETGRNLPFSCSALEQYYPLYVLGVSDYHEVLKALTNCKTTSSYMEYGH
jgi:hypothetical protein